MSYRSKRTRAQMAEADVPINATDNSDMPHLTSSSALTMRSCDTDERWGPFCPQKNKVPAVVKASQHKPSLKGCRLDTNINEPYAAKTPFSNTQVSPTSEKPPNGPGSRIQISHTFQEHVAKYPNPSFTTNPLLSKTHAITNSHDLAARKSREISAKQPDASQNMVEPEQVRGFKPPNSVWKSSTMKPDRSLTTNPLISKTQATPNLLEPANRKAREFSVKQHVASQMIGERTQVGVKPSASLCKKFTNKPDGSFSTNSPLSKTPATKNSYNLASSKQLDASQKMREQVQVGGFKAPDSLCRNSTMKPDHSFNTNHLHSKTHATLNQHERANRKGRELSAKQPDATQKFGEQAEVRFKPSDVLWKNSPSNSFRVFKLNSTRTLNPAFSLSQPTCSPPPSETVGTIKNGSNTVEKSSVEPQEEVLQQQDHIETSLTSFKPRRRSVVHDWPDNVDFDESEEVLIMDEEGNIKKVNDPIQPHDVWYAKNVRYCVTFNEFYQPLKKGGHILVRFIGDMARKEIFCPIRDTNWHHVPKKFKVDIVKCIREHFVLPDGDGYDKGILKRVGKSVRQYRHDLKKTFFKPTRKTREEIYQSLPAGVPRDSWIHLVDYWYSDKGKKFAECGKEARASQNHVHTTGSTSYANIRAEFEEKNKREPTELEVFKRTHKRKDGTYVKDTITEEFVFDADNYILSELATNATKPKVQIQNEAFNKLMYAEDIPKRPLGYGFGVKGSDVFGVHGILRKEAFKSGDSSNLALENREKMQNMEKVVLSLTKDKKELQTKLNETNIMLYKILEGMSSGMPSPEIAQLAKSTLNTQISDSTNGGGASR